jgi:DNA mismatch repair protein MutS
MYQEYYALWTKYQAEYGPKTAIFLMVGSFYELYDIQEADGRTKMNVKDIVDILGIQLKVKTGDAPGGLDGLFSGFPDYVLHKWAGKLTAAGWTVVVVDQVKDKHDKVVERRVARILSPSTHLEALGGYEAPIVAALFQGQNSSTAATFDLSTGSTYVATCRTKDDVLQLLNVFQPRELLYFGSGSEDEIRKSHDLPPNCSVFVRGADLGALNEPVPRAELLRRLFKPRTILPLLDYLHLENVNEEKALCALLRFVEDHMPSSFERLQATQRWAPTSLLLLGNHALSQLQILGSNGVLDLFKYTATTAFGKRALRQRLLQPSADAAVIEGRLAAVDAAAARADKQEIYKYLRSIYDLPRLHRKMVCADVGAADLLALQTSYGAADRLLNLVGSAIADAAGVDPATAAAALAANFDLEVAAGDSENTCFLPNAAHPEIAATEAAISATVEELNTFLNVVSRLAGGAQLRYESRERQPYGIRGTRTALTVLKSALGTPAGERTLAGLPKEQQSLTVSIQKGGGWVECDWLDRMNGRILGLREQLQRQFRLALPDVCAAFCDATGHLWQPLEDWIAAVDCSVGLATEAVARRWCRPTLREDVAAGLKAQGLRHPLIESLQTREAYVAHDVDLTDSKGWLVYGMNASGKSSLMKSVGIAVHLAQAGCYVPATSFVLAPYRSLFTRILNQDNLWAGLSSFAVEMSEMRDILRAADEWTLVLGDELCAGTESVSAKALVAAGILWLAERRSTFLFATHLHGLTDLLPDPASIGLRVWHLKVIYDAVNRRLIYERTLSEGSGSSLYGLEVARAMNVPVAFLDMALTIRRRLVGAVADEEAPRSSWNAAVRRRACEVCGSDKVKDLEVHHIHERAAGGSNDARNLMVLCEACHDRHHAAPEASVASQPLKMTSDGLERIVEPEVATVVSDPKPNPKGRAKWSDEERATILKVLAAYPNLPAKQIVFRLKHNEGIEISEASLRKFKCA